MGPQYYVSSCIFIDCFLALSAYCDSNCAGNISNRCFFTTGLWIFLIDSLLAWKSKKQSVAYCSFAEADYSRNCLASMLLTKMGPLVSYPLLSVVITRVLFILLHEWTKHIESRSPVTLFATAPSTRQCSSSFHFLYCSVGWFIYKSHQVPDLNNSCNLVMSLHVSLRVVVKTQKTKGNIVVP